MTSRFQILESPDEPATVFVTTGDMDLNYEETLRALAMQYRGWLSRETPTSDGGIIYKFQFLDIPSAKKAARDFKTARDFNF